MLTTTNIPRKSRQVVILLAGVLVGCAVAYGGIVANHKFWSNVNVVVGQLQFLRAGQDEMTRRINNLKNKIDAVAQKNTVIATEVTRLRKPPVAPAKTVTKITRVPPPVHVKKEPRRLRRHAKKLNTKPVYTKVRAARPRIKRGQVFLFDDAVLFVAPDGKQVLLRHGEKLPTGAKIVSIDPAARKILTSNGAIGASRFNQIMSRYGY